MRPKLRAKSEIEADVSATSTSMPEVYTVDFVLTALLPEIEPEEVEKGGLC